jgi:hypothetical protein
MRANPTRLISLGRTGGRKQHTTEYNRTSRALQVPSNNHSREHFDIHKDDQGSLEDANSNNHRTPPVGITMEEECHWEDTFLSAFTWVEEKEERHTGKDTE